MKLNVPKTKTMIVSTSSTIHPLSSPLTIGGTVLNESDEFDILRVTFGSMMTFEQPLRSVSRAASQRLGTLKKFSRLFNDRLHLERGFPRFVLHVLEYYLAEWLVG